MLFVGYPIWWVLGLTDVVTIVAAAAMFVTLLRTRLVRVPPVFGLLALFLVWVVLSFSTAQLAAPGAVAATDMNRYLTAGWRLLWYLKAAIVLLYLGNQRKRLSQLWICRVFGWMFVWIVAGGLIGVADPRFAFRSFAERVLPSGIVHTPFVYADIHPIAAELFSVFNGGAYRTSAPFAYANIWGLNFVCFLPFFVLGWLSKDNPRRRRWCGAALLVISVIPVVFSSNRAMWVALAVVAAFVAIRSAAAGHYRLLGAFFVGAIIVGAVVALSPLGSEISARLAGDGQTSSVTRTNLASIGLDGVKSTSPLLGFGATRQVQGSFTSIAGGATATCPRCTPPSFGTQGQLLLVTFTQGLIGAVLYFGFIGWQFARHLAARAKYAIAGIAVLLAHLLTSTVYSADNLAILAIFGAVALIWRSRVAAQLDDPSGTRYAAGEPTIQDYVSVLVRHTKAALALVVVGVLGGMLAIAASLPHYVATVPVTFPVDPTYDALGSAPTTLDTIARTVPSSITISAMQQAVGPDYVISARDLSVTASPNTRVLHLAYTGPSAKVARTAVSAAAASVLQQRAVDLQQDNHRIVSQLNARASTLSPALTDVRTATVTSVVRSALRPVIDELSLQVRRNNTFLAQASQVVINPGTVSAPPTVRLDNDSRITDLANGLAIGVLLAAALVTSSFVRSQRLPVRRSTTSSRSLPVLARGPSGTIDFRSLLRYRPGAFIAIGGSPVAAVTAQALENQLRPEQRDDAHGRVVLVATNGTRLGALARAARALRTSQVRAVGVVLVNVSRADAAAARPAGAGRRALGLVLCVLVFITAGIGIGQWQTRTWTATAEVALLPAAGTPLSPDTPAAQVPLAMASEAASVDSASVLRTVNRRLGRPFPATPSTVKAQVVTNTDDIAIRFIAGSPAQARRGAEIVAEVFLRSRSSEAAATEAARSATLRAQDAAISTKQSAAVSSLENPHAPGYVASDVIRLSAQLAAVRQNLADVQTSDTDPGAIVSSPGGADSADGPPSVVFVLGGGLAGLIVGAAVLGWQRRRPRVVRGRHVLDIDGHAVLAVVPSAAADDELTRNAYVCARVSLLESAGRGVPLAVLHVGSRPAAAADIAGRLAAALSDVCATVALVDGRGDTNRDPHPSVNVLPLEFDASTQPAQLSGSRFRGLLASLCHRYDIVVVDGPPVTTPEGAAVALAAGDVVLTVDEGTNVSSVRKAMRDVRRLGVRIRGVIVVESTPSTAARANDPGEADRVLTSAR